MCCMCMWTVYCWLFHLSFTGSGPLWRRTTSSPAQKLWVRTFYILISIKCLKHLHTIAYVNIEMCCMCMWTVYCWLFPTLFYRFRATWTRDTVISGSKPWAHTFYIRYSIKCLKYLLTIVNLSIEMCCMCMWTLYRWFFPLSFTGSVPLGRGTPSSPAQNCEYILSIY